MESNFAAYMFSCFVLFFSKTKATLIVAGRANKEKIPVSCMPKVVDVCECLIRHRGNVLL